MQKNIIRTSQKCIMYNVHIVTYNKKTNAFNYFFCKKYKIDSFIYWQNIVELYCLQSYTMYQLLVSRCDL